MAPNLVGLSEMGAEQVDIHISVGESRSRIKHVYNYSQSKGDTHKNRYRSSSFWNNVCLRLDPSLIVLACEVLCLKEYSFCISHALSERFLISHLGALSILATGCKAVNKTFSPKICKVVW